MTVYIGYSTNNPHEAAESYVKRMGATPTVIVARPEFQLTSEHPLVVRSNHGCANGLLVSHLIKPEEVGNGRHWTTSGITIEEAENEFLKDQPLKPVPDRKPGRPPRPQGCKCPHCGSEIAQFENLGRWYAWALGIEPPYWAALRLYVFARDRYTCQKCKRRLSAPELRCHHIYPKERGGTDGSRNLTTLCGLCHDDEHPIMPGDDAENSEEQ